MTGPRRKPAAPRRGGDVRGRAGTRPTLPRPTGTGASAAPGRSRSQRARQRLTGSGRGATAAGANLSRTNLGRFNFGRFNFSRFNFTGRAAVLALVICALALTLAYPLRSYLGQRAEVAGLEAQIAAARDRVTYLESAQRRWDDPAYVKVQARERLHYVMPGETQYVVLDPDEAPAPEEPATRGRGTSSPDRPWYTVLWQTVEGAAGTGSSPAPPAG